MDKLSRLVFWLLLLFAHNAFTAGLSDQDRIVKLVQQAANDIKTEGKEKAILKFREKSSHIFAIAYDGMILASPIHPETVGTNQFNFKDASGVMAVQAEIKKAKAGGGWVKGRYRPNHRTGEYECRKLYIHPMPGKYFIGSWYYYPAITKETCPI